MRFGALRLAVVLAVRQARRQRVRAVTILATLALPVAVVTAADVVTRTTHLSSAEQLDRQLSGAQAIISWDGYPLQQAPNPNAGITQPVIPATTTNYTRPPGPNTLPLSLLPVGTTATGEADAFPFVISATGGTNISIRGVDLRASAPGAGVRVRGGRVPSVRDEIALSPSLAAQLQARVGDTLRAPGLPFNLRVVGIVAERYSPGQAVAFTLAPTAEQMQTLPGAPVGEDGISQWYVSSPVGVGWPAVEAFNARGWDVTSRLVIDHPPPRHQVPYYRDVQLAPQAGTAGGGPSTGANPSRDRATPEVGAGVLAVMLLLEVALMAGPAFAVGARRRRHELAVIAASGGTRRQLIGFVIADGLVLGGIAAVAGAATGVGAGAVVLAGLREWTNRVPGSVTVRGWEIAGIALLALLSGLLAALIPALAASRADTAQVLRGRPHRAPLSWRPAAAGVVALGVAIGLGSATLNEDSNGGFPVPLVVAAALAEIGFVLLTPAILGLVGRFAGRLPLWPRLALRDASRNRSSAAPAVAAIIAVVAAATAALVFGSSVEAHDRVSWLPSLPTGDATAQIVSEPGLAVNPATALAAVGNHLPGARVAMIYGQTSGDREVVLVPPSCPAPTFQPQGGGGASSSAGYAITGGPDCDLAGGLEYLVDGGSATATMVGGAGGQAAAAALRAGKAVVFYSALLNANGDVSVALYPGQPSSARLPAVAVPSALPLPVASIIFPPAVAARLHIPSAPTEVYVKDAAAQPVNQIAAADKALEQLGLDGLEIQGPYHNGITEALLAVAGADLLLTVAATIAATALVTVDAGDDLLILAAVGAAPWGRRRLAMSRAAVIGGVGSVCGVLAGLIPGVGLVWRLRDQHSIDTESAGPGTATFTYPLHLPWAHLAVVVVAAPLLAAGAAAILSRSALPSEVGHRQKGAPLHPKRESVPA